jgi:type II secretory pathway pseudopilin PulG
MTPRLQSPAGRHPARGARAAFTLLEMLVAASILVLIIFSLYQMFNYTQRAFRSGVTQVDVNEGGRAVMEVVTREFEQAVPSLVDGVLNLFIMTNYVSPGVLLVGNPVDGYTNIFRLQDAYCLQPVRDQWRAVGYFVAESTTNASDVKLLASGVGTLFRYEAVTNRLGSAPPARNWMFNGFVNPPANAPVQRLLEGVVHFRVSALDINGVPMFAPYTALPADAVGYLATQPNRQFLTKFFDTAAELPAYLELELAVVEPSVLEIIKARTEGLAPGPVTTARIQSLLADQSPRVHVFRQRIPVRSVPR